MGGWRPWQGALRVLTRPHDFRSVWPSGEAVLQDAHAPGGDSSAPLVSRLTRRLVLRVSGCRAPWVHLPGPAGPAETSSDSPGRGVVPVGHHPPGLRGSLARRLVGGARYGGGRVARVPPDHLHWLGRRPVWPDTIPVPRLSRADSCVPLRAQPGPPSVERPRCAREGVSRMVEVAPPLTGHGADREPASGVEDEKSRGGRRVRGQGLRAPRLPGLHAGRAELGDPRLAAGPGRAPVATGPPVSFQ